MSDQSKRLDQSPRLLSLEEIAGEIIVVHRLSEQLRDMAIGACRLALVRAVQCAELLARARDLAEERGRGQFSAWLELQIETHDDFPSRSTCFNYLRALRYKETLGSEYPDFASLKELYIAAGILPHPESPEHGTGEGGKRETPLFRLKFDLAAPNPSEWQPIDRREFIAKAKPVVDLYNACREAEESAS